MPFRNRSLETEIQQTKRSKQESEVQDETESCSNKSLEISIETILTENGVEGGVEDEIEEDNIYSLNELKDAMEEYALLQKNDLLQDLHALKQEEFAKKEAKKLQRNMRRVKFQEASPPFCRSCCARKKHLAGVEDGSESKGKTNGTILPSNSPSKENKSLRQKKARPFYHVHSINMYENIIPRRK